MNDFVLKQSVSLLCIRTFWNVFKLGMTIYISKLCCLVPFGRSQFNENAAYLCSFVVVVVAAAAVVVAVVAVVVADFLLDLKRNPCYSI